eukprot:c18235_g1_i2.p1 GENE.c18235_g1_i2~~c18235_g1_i2.p1  ORF type:complete len:306 (+),score=70.77 c18235_g1_i2:49-966(+)
MSKADDPRMGTMITEGIDGRVVLVGFPFDEGVRRNGGRLGSSLGPKAFRTHVVKMGAVVNAEAGIDLREHITISDAGDVTGEGLEEGHANLTGTIAAILEKGGIPFVVGGGNDQSWPNALALLQQHAANASIGVVNIDAHLDVRPLIDGQAHSGSPFRQLLESDLFSSNPNNKFVEFACQGSQCSAQHVRYIEEKGGQLMWLSAIRDDPAQHFSNLLDSIGDKVFVSFDIDSIAARDAPGVSCPANQGLSSEQALRMMRLAGANPKVCLVDVSELNPQIEGYVTPRLVSNMFYEFCLGLAHRLRR